MKKESPINRLSNPVVIIQNLQKKVRLSPALIKKIVAIAYVQDRCRKSGEIVISLVDDKKITQLNKKYLKQNRPTDVLAFDLSENKDRLWAEIIISTDTAVRNAAIFDTSPCYESYLYVAHGVLHILGLDDLTSTQAAIMQKKADRIVSKLYVNR